MSQKGKKKNLYEILEGRSSLAVQGPTEGRGVPPRRRREKAALSQSAIVLMNQKGVVRRRKKKKLPVRSEGDDVQPKGTFAFGKGRLRFEKRGMPGV